MNKLIMRLVIAAIIFWSINILNAQPANSNGNDITRTASSFNLMKLRMQADLNLNDVKADSVCSIQQDYEIKQKQIRLDPTLSIEEKKQKTMQLQEKRFARWKAARLNDTELKRVHDFYSSIELAEMRR